jgi:hypothetical protein
MRVSISITAWPKRLRDSVGSVDKIKFEFCIGVFSEVAQSPCRRRKHLASRCLRSNRAGLFQAARASRIAYESIAPIHQSGMMRSRLSPPRQSKRMFDL